MCRKLGGLRYPFVEGQRGPHRTRSCLGQDLAPSNTMWPGPRPTCMPSFISIRPTVWPQYTNVRDRQTDRTDRQRSDSIGRTVFTLRRSYASAVLGVLNLSVCLSSVRPCVRLSHACFVINPKNLPAIFLYHMKVNPSSFLPPNSGWWTTSPSILNGRSK